MDSSSHGMMGNFKKMLLSKTFGIVSLLALILAIPFTVLVSQQQQDIRQSAHEREDRERRDRGEAPPASFSDLEKNVTNTRTLSPKLTLNEEVTVECTFDQLVTKQIDDKTMRVICAARNLGKLVGIVDEQSVTGKLFVAFVPNGGNNSIDKVEFYIDDTLVNTELSGPFVLGGKTPSGRSRVVDKKKMDTVLAEISLGYDTAQLPDGVHTLKVVAYTNGGGKTGTLEAVFTSKNTGLHPPTPTNASSSPTPSSSNTSPTGGGASPSATPLPASPTHVPQPTNYH